MIFGSILLPDGLTDCPCFEAGRCLNRSRVWAGHRVQHWHPLTWLPSGCGPAHGCCCCRPVTPGGARSREHPGENNLPAYGQLTKAGARAASSWRTHVSSGQSRARPGLLWEQCAQAPALRGSGSPAPFPPWLRNPQGSRAPGASWHLASAVSPLGRLGRQDRAREALGKTAAAEILKGRWGSAPATTPVSDCWVVSFVSWA